MEPKRKDRLPPDGRRKAHKTRFVPKSFSVETLRHSIATIAPVRSVIKKHTTTKNGENPRKNADLPHSMIRFARNANRKKALRPRTIASRSSGLFSGSRFAPLSPPPVSKNGEAMHVHPDDSSGAAPVSHWIPSMPEPHCSYRCLRDYILWCAFVKQIFKIHGIAPFRLSCVPNGFCATRSPWSGRPHRFAAGKRLPFSGEAFKQSMHSQKMTATPKGPPLSCLRLVYARFGPR